jgi:hypothetical protein
MLFADKLNMLRFPWEFNAGRLNMLRFPLKHRVAAPFVVCTKFV